MVFNEYDPSRPLWRTNHRVGCHPGPKFDDIHLGGGSISFRFPPTGRFRKDFRLIDTNRRLVVTYQSSIMSTRSHLDVSPRRRIDGENEISTGQLFKFICMKRRRRPAAGDKSESESTRGWGWGGGGAAQLAVLLLCLFVLQARERREAE